MSLLHMIQRGAGNGLPIVPYIYGASAGRPSPCRPHEVAAALASGTRVVRRGDGKAATILAFQEELTALCLLPQPEGMPQRPVRRLADPSLPPPARPRAGCGTEAGYRRHNRRKEPVCDACRAADSEAKAKRVCGTCGHRKDVDAHRKRCPARKSAAA